LRGKGEAADIKGAFRKGRPDQGGCNVRDEKIIILPSLEKPGGNPGLEKRNESVGRRRESYTWRALRERKRNQKFRTS